MGVRRSGVTYADFSGGDANHIIGCTKVGPECAHCYAEFLIEKRGGRDFSKVNVYPDKLARLLGVKFPEGDKPFRRGWSSRPIVFPVDLGDHFHQDVPAEHLLQALDTYHYRKGEDWLILTKRISRAAQAIEDWLEIRELDELPANMWLGTSIGCEESFYRLYRLMAIPAAVRWLSLEPWLENLTPFFKKCIRQGTNWHKGPSAIHWVALGGESGAERRRFDRGGAREMQELCTHNHIPFFFKQGSAFRPGQDDLLNGRKYKEFPGHCTFSKPASAATRASVIEL